MPASSCSDVCVLRRPSMSSMRSSNPFVVSCCRRRRRKNQRPAPIIKVRLKPPKTNPGTDWFSTAGGTTAPVSAGGAVAPADGGGGTRPLPAAAYRPLAATTAGAVTPGGTIGPAVRSDQVAQFRGAGHLQVTRQHRGPSARRTIARLALGQLQRHALAVGSQLPGAQLRTGCMTAPCSVMFSTGPSGPSATPPSAGSCTARRKRF